MLLLCVYVRSAVCVVVCVIVVVCVRVFVFLYDPLSVLCHYAYY